MEAPYVIREAYKNGYFLVSKPDSKSILAPVNTKWLNLYYP